MNCLLVIKKMKGESGNTKYSAIEHCEKWEILNKAINQKNRCKICTLIYCILSNHYKEILNKTRNFRKSANEQIARYDWERKNYHYRTI